jgi:hypothetical protein
LSYHLTCSDPTHRVAVTTTAAGSTATAAPAADSTTTDNTSTTAAAGVPLLLAPLQLPAPVPQADPPLNIVRIIADASTDVSAGDSPRSFLQKNGLTDKIELALAAIRGQVVVENPNAAPVKRGRPPRKKEDVSALVLLLFFLLLLLLITTCYWCCIDLLVQVVFVSLLVVLLVLKLLQALLLLLVCVACCCYYLCCTLPNHCCYHSYSWQASLATSCSVYSVAFVLLCH